MKKTLLFLAMAILCLSCAPKQESMERLIDRVFKLAETQIPLMDGIFSELSEERGEFLYPRSVVNGDSLLVRTYLWWGSGFFPGTVWYAYEHTGNEALKEIAVKYTLPLDPLRHYTKDHDIGFQLMCSYGNGLRVSDIKEYEDVIVDGAKALATRFNPTAGVIKSWDKNQWVFPVIIDNMMNLELLLKAAEISGDDSFRQIALTHARTTMKNHYRDDYSCYHLVEYDPETGDIVKRQTVQGLADSSAWSRGQAWGSYGYAMMYRFTKERDMLDHAVKVTDYQLRRLPEDGVPYWDYDSPEIPDDIRDASAGAILACALIELSEYVGAEKSAEYLAVAEKILRSLASEEYLASEGENYGFLLKHSTGNKPGGTDLDAPLTYADYYFVEALARYSKLGK